jgi:hypothetical protein
VVYRRLKIDEHKLKKNRDELRYSGRVGSSYPTSDACHVTLVTNPVISHEWGKGEMYLFIIYL